MRATSGTARVAGWDVATERDSVRRHIGLMFLLVIVVSIGFLAASVARFARTE